MWVFDTQKTSSRKYRWVSQTCITSSPTSNTYVTHLTYSHSHSFSIFVHLFSLGNVLVVFSSLFSRVFFNWYFRYFTFLEAKTNLLNHERSMLLFFFMHHYVLFLFHIFYPLYSISFLFLINVTPWCWSSRELGQQNQLYLYKPHFVSCFFLSKMTYISHVTPM